jgi:hypothetical protein
MEGARLRPDSEKVPPVSRSDGDRACECSEQAIGAVGRARLQRLTTGRRFGHGDSEGAAMFQALRERFSKDDAAKADRKARKAETVAKSRELKAKSQREHLERERHGRSGGGGS